MTGGHSPELLEQIRAAYRHPEVIRLAGRLEAVLALPARPDASVVAAELDMGESPAAFVAGWQAARAAAVRAARGETA